VYIHVPKAEPGNGPLRLYFEAGLFPTGFDEYSRKLFEGTGDGVLFYTAKENTIPFVTRYSKKTLFGFGFRLTEEQKENLRKRLAEICKPLYRWEAPYESTKKGVAKPEDYYPDYASQLYIHTGAEFL
jgi:hypothetical protein